MKCKIHPYESGVGVCATCLRERLVALVALTERLDNHKPSSLTPSPPHQHRQHHHDHHHHHHHHQQQQQQPDSLLFPRSVSPYVSHRRSLGESPSLQHHQLFYSTPQVTSTTGGVGIGGVPSRHLPRNKRRPFSLLSSLFGFRSNKHQNTVSENLPPDFNSSPFDSRVSDFGASSKQSWFSNLVRGKTKKGREISASTEVSSVFTTREFPTAGMGREGWCNRRRRECRGLSPDRDVMDQEEEEESLDSPGSRIPAPTPMRRHRRAPAVAHRGISGFSVFWSPLVRASPQRRCQVGAGEIGFSGEIRNGGSVGNGGGGGPVVLGVNRSRKLADHVGAASGSTGFSGGVRGRRKKCLLKTSSSSSSASMDSSVGERTEGV